VTLRRAGAATWTGVDTFRRQPPALGLANQASRDAQVEACVRRAGAADCAQTINGATGVSAADCAAANRATEAACALIGAQVPDGENALAPFVRAAGDTYATRHGQLCSNRLVTNRPPRHWNLPAGRQSVPLPLPAATPAHPASNCLRQRRRSSHNGQELRQVSMQAQAARWCDIKSSVPASRAHVRWRQRLTDGDPAPRATDPANVAPRGSHRIRSRWPDDKA
jgi:hypothetical protein